MAQLTLYIDETTLKKVTTEARRAHISLSKWVQMKLAGVLEKSWPAGYFDLFGSLGQSDFKRPSQGSWREDVRKERL